MLREERRVDFFGVGGVSGFYDPKLRVVVFCSAGAGASVEVTTRGGSDGKVPVNGLISSSGMGNSRVRFPCSVFWLT